MWSGSAKAWYKVADGKFLGFHWHDDPRSLVVWGNGKRHDWKAHGTHLYCSDLEDPNQSAPVFAPWGRGVLYVEAGEQAFASAVSESGGVKSSQGKPAEVRAWAKNLP